MTSWVDNTILCPLYFIFYKALYSYEDIWSSQQYYKMGVHIPILEVRKLRLKDDAYQLTQTVRGGASVKTWQPDWRVHRFPPTLSRKQLYWKRFPPVSCNWSHKSNLQINNRALFPSIATVSGRHNSSPGAAGCPGNPSAKTDAGCRTPTSAFISRLESIWEMNHVRINCFLLVLFSFHFLVFSLNGGYKLYKLDLAD